MIAQARHPHAAHDSADSAAQFLRANDEVYQLLLSSLRSLASRDAEAALWCARATAEFLQENHAGRFACGEIENVVLGIGRRLSIPRRHVAAKRSHSPLERRRVLHVATFALPVGGHTRTIRNWIANDRESRHSLLVTAQDRESVPQWLRDAIADNRGDTIGCGGRMPLLRRAALLRQVAHGSADLVVLHHYGFDVVPVVALAVDEGPPVLLLNHADHIFWMGECVSDAVVNQRQVGRCLSEARRSGRVNLLLPIPLSLPAIPDRQRARRKLGIPDSQTVFVSVGRSTKYKPSGAHDFASTARRILREDPSRHLYLVGTDRAGEEDRVHRLGCIDDPIPYLAAADVYLEGFPFGSQTALLEAALCGLPVVRACCPITPLLVTDDDAINPVVSNPASEREYVCQASSLARNPGERERLGASLRQRVLESHTGRGWYRQLDELYRCTSAMRHRARRISSSPSHQDTVDLAIGGWQMTTRSTGGSTPASRARRALMMEAYGAGEAGCARAAMRLLGQSAAFNGWDRSLVSATLKVPPRALRAWSYSLATR